MTNKKQNQLLKNRKVESIYPLSAMQQGMLFHSLYAPESGVYVEQIAFVLNGTINVDAFQYAWQEVVDRYAVFRTLFVWKDRPTPLQVVVKNVALPWKYMDWQELSTAEQQRQLVELLARQREQGFALNQPPLMDCTLIKLSKEGYRFIWRHHHILMDGWCVPIILREFLSFYEAKVQGKTCYLPAPPPYRDYIVWLNAQDQETAMEFWRQTLQGFCASTPLGVDRLQSDNQRQQSSHYQERKLHVASNVTRTLQSIAQQHRATLSTIVQAAWALLLSRYSGERDVVFGVTVSGRPGDLSGVEKMVGLFINTLPLRVQLSPAQRLIHWLEQIQESMVELQQYSYSPLFEIQALSEIPGGTPLFESIVVFENYPVNRSLFADSSIELCESKSFEQTNYPLTVVAVQREELLVKISYDAARFESETIERMLGHLETIFTAIAGNPECCVGDIDLLSEAERGQLLVEWNRTESRYPADKCVHYLFEEQVEQAPHTVAVVCGERQLTYQQLDRKANQLAHHLQGLGVGPEVLVGICLERGLEMVIAVLGVLKAGGAYVPLDPEYPQERLAFMLSDTGSPVLLTLSGPVGEMPRHEAKVICMDSDWDAIARHGVETPVSGTSVGNLAYVIYTSGSTGKPKGVAISHGGLLNLVFWHRNVFEVTASDRATQLAGTAFDASVWEVWPYLTAGARLHVVSAEELVSPERLRDWLMAEEITLTFLPTPLAEQILKLDWPQETPLRTLLTGGDKLHRSPSESIPFKVVNNYGPTENTVVTTSGVVLPNGDADIQPPIGCPIFNTEVYVLDERLRPAPVGVPGELWIGGESLARGYWNRPRLTAENFIPNPYSDTPGARLYKTGDLVRYLEDGSIEFLGRIDHQVKIRGFRIELGEVESVLSRHPAVEEAVVIVREDVPGNKRLVAYVVASQEPTLTFSELRSFLKEKLPEYMIPTAFVFLDLLPLTPNGKVDRRALPAPDRMRPGLEEVLIAPRTQTEELVAGIWSNVLGVERIGVHDNFFELGGHSLLATQVIARVWEYFRVEVPLRQLFEGPTIEGLAEVIENTRRAGQTSTARPLVPCSRADPLPLSFAQQRLWFLDRLEPGSTAYSMPYSVRLRGALDLRALDWSLNELVKRHESLRTVFAEGADEPIQVILPSLQLPVSLVDLQSLPEGEREAEMRRLSSREAKTLFDLAVGPLIRAQVIRMGTDDHVVLLTLHHIISDGWSTGIMFKELEVVYQARCEGQKPTLPPLPVQYADYAVWQREYLQGERLEKEVDYWRKYLHAPLPTLRFPTDFPRPSIQSHRGAREGIVLSPELMAGLLALSQQSGTTLFMTLLAIFQALVHRWSGQDDVCVGIPSAGRTQVETEGLIGFFVNTLVVRTLLSDGCTFHDLQMQVRAGTLEAYARQTMPFEKLVEVVQPTRDLSRTPVFQTFFNMVPSGIHPFSLSGVSVEGVSHQDPESKFDLTLYVRETAAGIRLSLVYNADLFRPERIQAFLHQFRTVAEQVVQNPAQPLEAFSLVTSSARSYLPDPQQTLEVEWVGPVWSRLAGHALKRGEAIAIASTGESWTYQDLESRSNQLAHCLLKQGVKAQEPVAIWAARSPELVLALLGILKAGASFMILDPSYPSTRLLEMLQIAGPRGLIHLDEAGLLPDELDAWAARVPCRVRLPAFATGETDYAESWGGTLETAPEVEVQPDDVAYVTFTSGSTGTPKCLRGTHRPLSHFMRWYAQALQLTAADRVTMFSGLAHDPLLRDLFTPLWIGGTLCIPDEEALASGRVGDWMNEQEITLLHLTPPLADVLSAGRDRSKGACTALRYAVFGGDSLRPVHLDSIKQLAPQASCVNAYGATETPQIMSWYVVPPDFSSNVEQVPIGQGIDGVQVLVLNDAGQPAGIGELGEIYIRTPYLTQGYVNDEALTSARFLPNPFRQEAGDRIYRTGDLGRMSPDGSIEFVGRRDSQVKIRGFRIEVGEVEAALGRHPAVRDVVVVPGEDGQGERYLVAYLATDEDGAPSISEVRGFLQQKLPEYMIPSAFVFLDTLPRTPNGKVDYRALPEPDLERSRLETQFVAPRTQVEKVLAKIWGEVLGLERVGVHDNFFDLGGQSLLAVRLFARIQKILGKDLPLITLFQAPTIGQLASIIQQEGLTTPWSSLVPIQTGGSRPPFFCVHGCSGRVLHFYDLARSLGPEQPFYGLSALGSEKGQVPLTRIEEMAAHYINAIRSVQVNGPYVIGASGFGCGIVLEMAHQLEAQGQTVKLLALMSPSPLKPKRTSKTSSRYFKYLKVFYRLAVVHLKARPFLPALYNAFSNRVLWHFRIFHRFMPVEIYRWRRFMETFSKARRRYEPKAYQGRITCFLHDDFPRIPKKAIGDWYDLAVNEPDVRFVPGNIFSMWEKSHVQTLADQLKASLDEALTDTGAQRKQSTPTDVADAEIGHSA